MAKVAILSPDAVDAMHVAEHREPQDLAAPPAGATRIAPVRRVEKVERCAPGSSALVVTSYDGRVEIVQLPGEPDADAVNTELPHAYRPLAVRFELRSGMPRCTCVVTSDRRPQRVVLSLSAALALVARGVHGIVTSVPPSAAAVYEGDSCGEAPVA